MKNKISSMIKKIEDKINSMTANELSILLNSQAFKDLTSKVEEDIKKIGQIEKKFQRKLGEVMSKRKLGDLETNITSHRTKPVASRKNTTITISTLVDGEYVEIKFSTPSNAINGADAIRRGSSVSMSGQESVKNHRYFMSLIEGALDDCIRNGQFGFSGGTTAKKKIG